MRHAVDSISFDPDDIICEASAEDKTITLTVELNETLAKTFQGHGITGNGESELLAAYVDRKPGDTSPPSYALSSTDANPNTFTATIPVEKNRTGKDVTHYVELYFLKDVNKSNNGGVDVKKDQVYFGKVASYTVKPVQFLTANDFSINYINFPDEGSTIYANEAPSMTLGVNVSKTDATYKTTDQFEWTSSNDNIATISNKKDTWGQISLGSGTGEVSFTLKALNGDEEDEAHHPTITSRSFTVQVGDNPYLNATPNLTVRRGQPVTVQWITNLMYKWDDLKKGEPTNFTVTVYKYDDNAADNKGEKIDSYVVTASKENPISRFTFPDGLGLSDKAQDKWIITVSATGPGNIPYSSNVTVEILENPASVKLTSPDNPFLTDKEGKLTVSWEIKELDLKGTGSQFNVTVRNSQTGTMQELTGLSNAGADEGKGTVKGSHSFSISNVGSKNHRDIYTVEVTASNKANQSPSFDAATFYGYDSTALSLWNDGEDAGDSLTMSNEDKIKKMIGTGDVTGQQNVLDLNRNISLTEGLSINQDKDWGSVSDQIIWESSDESTATFNYRQGYSYQNIKDYSRISFGPTANFLLSGLGSGETAVTATHAQLQEKLQATLNVQVNTLADKLYLFQLYPATETTLTYQYKDEKGQVKQGVTTSTGSGGAAIYAPGGIVGDVYCKSTNNNTVYVGTIYHDALLSGERDSTKLELYPMNTFSLRQVAVADFYLKQPDGNPFEGDVTVHAGVYKNGTYCENALFGTTAGNVHTSGVDGLK